MRTVLLFCFTLVSFSFLLAQPEKQAQVKASLKIASGTKVGGIATLVFEVSPNPNWHVYSLEETGAYKKTEIILGEKCLQISANGAAQETGKKVTEFDEVMGGNLNYFEGPAIFTQEIKLTGKKPHAEGLIEFQLCNGDKCVMLSEAFKLEGKVK